MKTRIRNKILEELRKKPLTVTQITDAINSGGGRHGTGVKNVVNFVSGDKNIVRVGYHKRRPIYGVKEHAE